MTNKTIVKYLKRDGINPISGTINGINFVGVRVDGRKFSNAVRNVFVPYLIANRKPITKVIKRVATAISK